MASHIEIRAEITPDVSKSDVYAALRTVTDEDLSVRSPVSEQLRQVAVVMHGDHLLARSHGHRGQWSQTSQEAVIEAIESVDGVSDVEVVDGGFEASDSSVTIDPPDEDEPDDGGDDPSGGADVAEIDGVGAARAEQLREAGIESVDDVIDVGADGLVDAGLPEGVAENIVERA